MVLRLTLIINLWLLHVNAYSSHFNVMVFNSYTEIKRSKYSMRMIEYVVNAKTAQVLNPEEYKRDSTKVPNASGIDIKAKRILYAEPHKLCRDKTSSTVTGKGMWLADSKDVPCCKGLGTADCYVLRFMSANDINNQIKIGDQNQTTSTYDPFNTQTQQLNWFSAGSSTTKWTPTQQAIYQCSARFNCNGGLAMGFDGDIRSNYEILSYDFEYLHQLPPLMVDSQYMYRSLGPIQVNVDPRNFQIELVGQIVDAYKTTYVYNNEKIEMGSKELLSLCRKPLYWTGSTAKGRLQRENTGYCTDFQEPYEEFYDDDEWRLADQTMSCINKLMDADMLCKVRLAKYLQKNNLKTYQTMKKMVDIDKLSEKISLLQKEKNDHVNKKVDTIEKGLRTLSFDLNSAKKGILEIQGMMKTKMTFYDKSFDKIFKIARQQNTNFKEIEKWSDTLIDSLIKENLYLKLVGKSVGLIIPNMTLESLTLKVLNVPVMENITFNETHFNDTNLSDWLRKKLRVNNENIDRINKELEEKLGQRNLKIDKLDSTVEKEIKKINETIKMLEANENNLKALEGQVNKKVDQGSSMSSSRFWKNPGLAIGTLGGGIGGLFAICFITSCIMGMCRR